MSEFSLLLFAVEPPLIREAVAGGVAAIVVDWERMGKERRQATADTEINQHTLEDLRTVRACTRAPVICRINGVHAATRGEVESALEAGADEILVPMVREVGQVEQVLEFVRERAAVSILVETENAVQRILELARLPLARIYVGLNDLAIERGSANIFRAVADGTVEAVRRSVSGPFGFGGLTLPEGGKPLPCRLLMAEMARLGCSFTLLRRSFRRDVEGRNAGREVARMLEAYAACRQRTADETERDRKALLRAIAALTSAEAVLSRPRP